MRLHHFQRDQLAHWQQGPRQWDATTSWRASLCQQASSINGSLTTVSHKAVNDHGRETTCLSHWRWSFHTSTNEVPSLTIKTASISPTNKEEQLSATPLDNQGGTWVCISNEPQLVNQESIKIKKGWWKENMQLSVSSSLRSDGAKKS